MYNCMPTFHGKTYQVIFKFTDKISRSKHYNFPYQVASNLWLLTWNPPFESLFFLHTYGQRLPSYDFRVPRWRPGRYVRERVRFPVRRCHVGGTTAVTSENVGVSWLFEKMQMGKPMMAKVVLFVFEGLNAGGRWKVRPKQSSTYNYVVKLL